MGDTAISRAADRCSLCACVLTVESVQTRSLDEAATTFRTCPDCGPVFAHLSKYTVGDVRIGDGSVWLRETLIEHSMLTHRREEKHMRGLDEVDAKDMYNIADRRHTSAPSVLRLTGVIAGRLGRSLHKATHSGLLSATLRIVKYNVGKGHGNTPVGNAMEVACRWIAPRDGTSSGPMELYTECTSLSLSQDAEWVERREWTRDVSDVVVPVSALRYAMDQYTYTPASTPRV